MTSIYAKAHRLTEVPPARAAVARAAREVPEGGDAWVDEVQNLASYRGHTRIGRRRAGGGRADWHLEQTLDRRDLVDRARQLERTSVFAETILAASTENVIGRGFTLQPNTESDDWNAEALRLWDEWTKDPEVRGISTWDEILTLKYRSFLRDGDVGTILLGDGKLQAFESDQLSTPNAAFLRRDMVDGIKLDRRGRPTSFFIVTTPDPVNPSVRFQQHEEIPAKHVIFLAKRQRLGQTRGTPAFAGSAWLFDQIDGTIEAVTVAARMAASFVLVIKKASGTLGGLPQSNATSDGVSRPKWTIEPGMFKTLRLDETLEQIKPEQPTTNFPEYIASLIRFVAIEFGLPLELFFDFANANFSNHKAAMLTAQRNWRCRQKMMENYSSKVYLWKLMEWMRAGLLDVRADAFDHEWDVPGWRWLDPVKEFQAAQAAVDAGFVSPSGVVQQQGGNFKAIQSQRKRDFALIEQPEGASMIRGTMTREILTPSPGNEPNAKGDDKNKGADEDD